MKITFTCLCLLLLLFACKKDKNVTPPPVTPPVVVVTSPEITEIKIEAKNNTGKVTADVVLTADGTNLKGYTPGTAEGHNFVLTFKTKDAAATVKIGDVTQVSGVTANDFTKPVTYTVTDSKSVSKDYIVSIYNFTGLPIFNITTSGPVVSKDDYVTGSLKVNTNGLFEQTTNDIALQIKGRGNSTWGMPKKPYRLKADFRV